MSVPICTLIMTHTRTHTCTHNSPLNLKAHMYAMCVRVLHLMTLNLFVICREVAPLFRGCCCCCYLSYWGCLTFMTGMTAGLRRITLSIFLVISHFCWCGGDAALLVDEVPQHVHELADLRGLLDEPRGESVHGRYAHLVAHLCGDDDDGYSGEMRPRPKYPDTHMYTQQNKYQSGWKGDEGGRGIPGGSESVHDRHPQIHQHGVIRAWDVHQRVAGVL